VFIGFGALGCVDGWGYLGPHQRQSIKCDDPKLDELHIRTTSPVLNIHLITQISNQSIKFDIPTNNNSINHATMPTILATLKFMK
jgi:hypothetical protein